MKTCPEICTFQDFVNICDKSGVKIKPIVMQYHEFYKFEDGHRNRKSRKITLPNFDSIWVARFQKGLLAVCFKQDFERDYQKDFLKSKFKLNVTQPTKNNQEVLKARNARIFSYQRIHSPQLKKNSGWHSSK